MSLFTSSRFASCAAAGTDWRDTSRAVLEHLSRVRTSVQDFNFGFLYISDHLGDDASSILSLFKSVLGIEHWIGATGLALCSVGRSHIDTPAISAMIGRFDAADFCMIPPFATTGNGNGASSALDDWLAGNTPMLAFVHGDPMADEDPETTLMKLDAATNAFIVGGLSSSRKEHFQFAGGVHSGALCGAVFSSAIDVATTLSQGCTLIGDYHTITRADGHTLIELDSKRAVSVFENDIRQMAIKATGKDPDTVMVDEAAMLDKTQIPEEFQTIFSGEVNAALPIAGSDRDDYLVRNIIGLDPDRGTLSIAQQVSAGERVVFVHRDQNTVFLDLRAKVAALRARVEKTHNGRFEPKGAVYISCAARAFHPSEHTPTNELSVIREIIGDVPLTGFYAGGEISKARLYGYTGILTLFL